MDGILMQPQAMDDEEDFGALDVSEDFDTTKKSEEDDLDASAVDLASYKDSTEAQEASWWDWTKDVLIQPALGLAQAFTWPLDVIKMGVIGEAYSDIDQIEAEFQKAGKPFDREKYLETISDFSGYIPTVGGAKELVKEKTDIDLEPKTETGKFLNKAFTLAKLAKGSLPIKAASGFAGASTTQGLKALGVNETVSEIAGDLASGGPQALIKEPRKFTPEVERLRKIADKYGIPFYEFMTQKEGGVITGKISHARDAAIRKELGISSQEAAKQIIEDKIPISQLRKQKVNLDLLEDSAYDKTRQLAKQNPQKLNTKEIVDDINKEISRIKGLAPSPSDAQQTAIKILQDERKALTVAPKPQPTILGPNGQPLNPQSTKRLPKDVLSEDLINQHINYNSNVKGVYRKPEFTGKEEAVKGAYAFLNNSIRETMAKNGAKDVVDQLKHANGIFSQNAILKRSEALIDKAFVNGEYNPKKLSQVLDSKQGKIFRRELGDKAVKELQDIAEYGKKAVDNTTQLLKSKSHASQVAKWGSVAPFILGSTSKMKGLTFMGIPLAEKVKGYLLARPATREIYSGIIKSAAKGSFNGLKADFDKLEEAISGEFGSVDDFVKKMIDDLEVYQGDFE